MKKTTHKIFKIIPLLMFAFINLQTASAYTQAKDDPNITDSWLNIVFGVDQTELQEAVKQFRDTTGYGVNVVAHTDKQYTNEYINLIRSWIEDLYETFKSKDNVINIDLYWKVTGNDAKEVFTLDVIEVNTEKAEESFSADALQQFNKTLQAHKNETNITQKNEITIDDDIVAALKILQHSAHTIDKNVVSVLQERITLKLSDSKEQFQKWAYEHKQELTEKVVFDPSFGGGGYYSYTKRQMVVGDDKEYNQTDEDIMSTIYHEFMHYLCDVHKIYIYRKQIDKPDYTYQLIDECYEERVQTKEEFLSETYYYYNIKMPNLPDVSQRIDYTELPAKYTDLIPEQAVKFEQFIANENLKPEKVCISYPYEPSNYSKNEINAHEETLNAHHVKVFTMNEEKVQFYNKEIERYKDKFNQSIRYEKKKKLTPEGNNK
jgi:hypothetical protein